MKCEMRGSLVSSAHRETLLDFVQIRPQDFRLDHLVEFGGVGVGGGRG